MKPYNPNDWYWKVTSVPNKVYSSKLGDYVADTDATYVDWASDGTMPTVVETEDDLGNSLANASLRPANVAVLDKFKDAQASKLTLELVAKVLFNHENRIRVLEGKQPVTANQFANALKGML